MENGFVSYSMRILERLSLHKEIHAVDHHEKLVFLVILQNLKKCLENVLVIVLMEYLLMEYPSQLMLIQENQSPDTREQSGQLVMTREKDNGISAALDPQEVVCLGGTTLAEVILVKGHELPTIGKVLPVGFHLNPTSVNT
nr:hypothetical protein [Tanacetum cinerariifolium]